MEAKILGAGGPPVTVVAVPPTTGGPGTLKYDKNASLLHVANSLGAYVPAISPVRKKAWGYFGPIYDGANSKHGSGVFFGAAKTSGNEATNVNIANPDAWGRAYRLFTGPANNDLACCGMGQGTNGDNCITTSERRPWLAGQFAFPVTVAAMRMWIGWVNDDPTVAAQGSGSEPTGQCSLLSFETSLDSGRFTLLTRGATTFARTSLDVAHTVLASTVYSFVLRTLVNGDVQLQVFDSTMTLIGTAFLAAGAGTVPAVLKPLNCMMFIKTLAAAAKYVGIYNLETDTDL